MRKFEQILSGFWGYSEFRPLQQEIIDSVLEGRDTLALMPTGGGKSLTFQVPSLAMDGICIVVTPLIALMKDQVDQLLKRKIKAAAIHSGMTRNEINNHPGQLRFRGFQISLCFSGKAEHRPFPSQGQGYECEPDCGG